MERRQEDAAIEGVEVDQPVEQVIAAGGGLAAVHRPLGAEQVLDPAAEARHVPGQGSVVDCCLDSLLEPLA